MKIYNIRELESRQTCVLKRVRDAARHTLDDLNKLSKNPLEALHLLRFEKGGYHPLEGHNLNLSEQLNQTFHVLATLAATRFLLERYPNSGGLRLNPTTGSGMDIESIIPNQIAAEVLTATHPKNNPKKVKKDFEKVYNSGASHRYLFYYVPSLTPGHQPTLERTEYKGVKVWALGQDEVMLKQSTVESLLAC